MNKYFKCEVKHLVTDNETGEKTLVTEIFLIKAVSFTDAELSITKQMELEAKQSFSISNIVKVRLHGFVDMDQDEKPFFMVKIAYFVSNGQKEKKITESILVRAKHLNEAVIAVTKFCKESTAIDAIMVSAGEYICHGTYIDNGLTLGEKIEKHLNEGLSEGVSVSMSVR